jgi:hypothetical protein
MANRNLIFDQNFIKIKVYLSIAIGYQANKKSPALFGEIVKSFRIVKNISQLPTGCSSVEGPLTIKNSVKIPIGNVR